MFSFLDPNRITVQKGVSRITLCCCTLLLGLTGCGGGGGGTSIASDNESPDPVVLDIPIAYIKRPQPATDNNGQVSIINIENPVEIFPGARLLVRPRSSNLADEIDVSDQIIEKIAAEENVAPELLSVDIKDIESSFDGSTLIFAVRAIPDIDNNDEPELHTWNLWTYDIETDTADYLIQSALIRNDGAETGGAQDMAPHYLTDDRIVFISTRQSAIQERQLNEGRGQRYSAVSETNNNIQAVALHIYDPDSEQISQISLNQSIDLDPATLNSGEIIFSHWESNQQLSLYQINPSGAQLSALYGANSGDLIASEETTTNNTQRMHFLQPREMPDGRILSLIRSSQQTQLGGDLALIDTAGFIELFTPVNDNPSSASRGQLAVTDLEINALDELSPGGKFLAAYPLQDGTDRILTSWSPCRVQNSDGLNIPCSIATDEDRVIVDQGGQQNLQLQAAPSLFGLWVYNPAEQTQKPVVVAEEGFVISEVVAAEPRSFPSIPDEQDLFDADLAQQNKGLIIIDSVYNQDDGLVPYAPLGIAAYAEPGTLAYQNRPARFMRVLQPVPIPNDDVLDDLPNDGGAYGLLEILGYTPIEPDGSVSAKVQADTPIMLNMVTADGRRISRRHTHWLQVAKGEILRCVGCHEPGSAIPHGRLDSQPDSQNPGAVSLNTGLEGFIGANPALFASELGQTMAEAYDLHKPDSDESKRVRDLQLELTYTDEWTDTGSGLIADADIDLRYDPAWAIPEANAIIAPNLDPELQGRIVINYNDHIQPIWDRSRTISQNGMAVIGPEGTAVSRCTDCHSSGGDTRVPAGQLDLTDTIADGIFTRSYLELTRADNEQWITTSNGLADRQRICTVTDENDLELQEIQFFTVPASVNRGSALALASNGFFNCFEIDGVSSCGNFQQDNSEPPANCTDDGGTVAAQETFNHYQLLTPSELRLISEWLDIGSPFYTNPFDPRLFQ